MDRTDSKSDTGLTQRDSRPVLYELIDSDGNNGYGKFATAYAAGCHARLLWPDQSQDEDRTGKGWDVRVVGCDR